MQNKCSNHAHTQPRKPLNTTKLTLDLKRKKKSPKLTLFMEVTKWTSQYQHLSICTRSILWRHSSFSNFSALFYGFWMNTGTTVFSTLVCCFSLKELLLCKDFKTWKDSGLWEKLQRTFGCLDTENGKRWALMIYTQAISYCSDMMVKRRNRIFHATCCFCLGQLW